MKKYNLKPHIVSKAEFIKIINNILEQEEKNDKFSQGLEILIDGNVLFDMENKFKSSLIDLLKIIFKDCEKDKNGYSTIDWYFEHIDSIPTINFYNQNTNEKYKINIDTPDKLYILLLIEYDNYNNDNKQENIKYMNNMEILAKEYGKVMTAEEILELEKQTIILK